MLTAHRALRTACAAIAVAAVLQGCGGGGGSGGTTTGPVATYAVGGSASGIPAGSALVLQQNGADDLTLSADGPFAFRTRLAAGAAYAVTVRSSPPATICALARATGRVGSSDVTDVAASCSPDPGQAPVAIRGTVQGLTADGLVLHSDAGAGEDLAVPAGATAFAFTSPVAPGTAVTVTVARQPAGVSCGVSPASQAASATATFAATCRRIELQRWTAPPTWGALWSDADAALVQHAWFTPAGLQESKGIAWGWGGAGAPPAPRALGALAGTTRHGAGPFGPAPADRYQAANDPLAVDGDMIVCAVVKPGFNPITSGLETGIVAKGWTTGTPLAPNPGGGWVLMQMHSQFCFHYEYTTASAPGTSAMEMVFTPTEFADAGQAYAGTLNPSYVVVCAGRDGDSIRIAANGVESLASTSLLPGAHLDVAAGTPATIGGYPGNAPNHAFAGRIYETAVWRQAATPANLQAKLAAVQGLVLGDGSVATYARNREGPFVGPDGGYHTTWRHGPRLDARRGMLFGLQGWNRLSTWTCSGPPCPPGDFLATAMGEELDLWTRLGGATVLRNQLEPPGDSEQPAAELVTLPAGAGLSVPTAAFDRAGPVHAQLWIRPAPGSTSGVIRASLAPSSAGAASTFDIDLAATTAGAPRYPAATWTRVWLTGLTTNGAAGTFTLQNVGSTAVSFHAWGVDVTQIGGGADLGAFDPGPAMYDWSADNDPSNGRTTRYPQDVLQLPPPAGSTAAAGFCLGARAGMPDALAWTAPFPVDRTAAAWAPAAASVATARIFLEGGTGRLCFAVGGASACGAVPAGWAAGSAHDLVGCVSPAGQLSLVADGAPVGTPVAGVVAPDLATGRVLVGNGSTGPAAGTTPSVLPTPWHGWVSSAVACAYDPAVTACR